MSLKRDSAVAHGIRRYDRPVATDAEITAARKIAAERIRGMYAHLAPGRSVVDELIADRRAEARADDLEEAERRRREKS